MRGEPLLYSPQRALEAVGAISGLAPVRLFSVLFPLWEVETVGTQRRSRPYEMLDWFLERGIAEGELRSASELSAFLGLERGIVDKALERLKMIEHVQEIDGKLVLTNLGHDSLEHGVSYWDMETRRKLYFEAFNSHPLPQDHYRLRFLSEAEALTHPDRHSFRLFSFRPWRPSAVSDLERRPDRAKWNLPDEVRGLEERAVARAFLPMYVIETREPAATRHYGARYVVLTRLRGLRDTFFEDLVNSETDLLDPLYAEAVPNVQALMEERVADWDLSERQVRLTQFAPGAWRAVVAPEVFLDSQTKLTLTDIGKYQLVRGYCLQIWCDDPALRREAALDQSLAAITHWRRPTTERTVGQLLETLATRLQTRELELAELWEWASKRKAADVLHKLIELEI
jgi:hypothetical protein